MRIETHSEQAKRHADEFSKFEGLFFAFNSEQFKTGMAKVGATENNQLLSIGGGGYLKKTKEADFDRLCSRHKKERSDRLKDEKNLLDALVYELGNHEYGYTLDATDATEALGLKIEEIPAQLLHKAISIYNKFHKYN